MLKKLRQQNQGFTIIEVLIVLAIAGLILLIVFLAVPALQRNARNTTKRSDASKALGAVGEFVANNNGTVPATGNVGTLQTAANLSSGTTITSTIPTTVATVVAPSNSEIEVGSGLVCSGTTLSGSASYTAAQWQTTVSAGSSRAVVGLFTVEAAGGNVISQCLTS